MKTEYRFIALSIIFGLFVWVIDAALDYLAFYEGSFWALLIFDIPRHEVYIRSVILASFTIFGIIISGIMANRQRAEESLRKADRALRVLSACNQAVVRATEESALLQQVCQLLVEVGGYRLAWVGFAEQDEAKSVRPVAQVGFEEGYLDTVNITWADTERGRGPTGTAIRTDQVALARDIPTDPDFAPWRREATRRGYASSIALPLTAEGQTLRPDSGQALGALNIYAAEPDAFDAEEVKLLTELAGDLAYGITTLRTRAAREQAEAALRESEEKFRTFSESTLAALWVYQDYVCVYANPAAERITGYTTEELASMKFWDFVHPDHQNAVIEGGKAMEGGETPPSAMELEIVTKDGAERWIVGRMEVIEYEGKRASLISALDISERKRMEEMLRESEEKFRTLTVSSPVGMFLDDAQGNAIYINEKCAELVGMPAEEALNLDWVPAIHPDDRERVTTEWAKAVKNGQDFHLEYRWVHADGEVVWTLGDVVPVRGSDGEITVYIGTLTDITERVQAEEEIKQRSRELATLLEVSQALTATLDLNTVLQTSINGAAGLMEVGSGAIYLLEGETLYLGATTPPLPPQFPEEFRRAPLADHPHIRQAIATGRPVILPDTAVANLTPAERAVSELRGLRSIVYAPLLAAEGAVGVWILASVGESRAFSEVEIDLSRTLSTQVALAIENARLYASVQHHVEELERRVAERTAELAQQYRRQAAIEERQRLARELHDAVSQALFSASLMAETLPRLWERNPEGVPHVLRELHRLTRGALTEMRTLLLELRPKALEEADLGELLRQLTDALAGRTQVAVSLQVEGQRPLPLEVRTTLFRIAQESLNNVAKHARADQVWVSLTPTDLGGERGGAVLSIRDDGRGFDPDQVSPGRLGLEIMRERAEAIGASLKITSQPDHGTEVLVSWQDSEGGETHDRA